jgi:hypothetical protein
MNTLAYLASSSKMKEKKFHNIGPWNKARDFSLKMAISGASVIKLFTAKRFFATTEFSGFPSVDRKSRHSGESDAVGASDVARLSSHHRRKRGQPEAPPAGIPTLQSGTVLLNLLYWKFCLAGSSILYFRLQVIYKSYRQLLTLITNFQLLLKLEILDKLRLVTSHKNTTQRKHNILTGSISIGEMGVPMTLNHRALT